MNVIISGSRSISALPVEAKERIDKILGLNAEVLVGDAPGVDVLVQEYLAERGYKKVRVFHAYSHARNNIGNWPMVGGFDSYIARDKEMCLIADYGLAVWDGKSKGTKGNIHRIPHRVVCV